ncbi:hypothetical protein FE697_019000 [Mumia zhuanghuii]|uniref:Excreted virulence factor EspC, type VII ESX diderm n=2 Tax=Mumia TaxID=1546255 RepID=A0ABW1QKQ9_9ACTN|nr:MULTISPECIES: hypothetical protein [Mumia]KAA1419979.1 hypothetical protein FE697_019000 [Mumia zhuanghuii]
MTYQLRADVGVIDEASADLTRYAGALAEYRESLRAESASALATFGGGVGSEEHAAAMRIVDTLVDEHLAVVTRQGAGAAAAGDTFGAAGARMRTVLGSGS